MRTENDSNKEGRPVDTMEPLDHTRGVKFLSAVRKALRGHSEHAQNLGPIGGKLQYSSTFRRHRKFTKRPHTSFGAALRCKGIHGAGSTTRLC